MIRAPYDKNRNYDIMYEKIINLVSKTIDEKDDDYLLLYIGQPGSGKSRLMLHGYEIFDPEGCDIDYVGINKESFAEALYKAKQKPILRFCANDEANINSRDAMTKYNKDVLHVYKTIRGKRIFHAWCNPDAECLDKPFINDRIKGIIYVATKDIDRPRIYYFFRKKDILLMLEKEKSLSIKTFEKHSKKYAYYQGWFKDYHGSLEADYMKKKDKRMDDNIDEFYNKYGDVKNKEDIKTDYPYMVVGIAKTLLISHSTVLRYFDNMYSAGVLKKNEDFVEGVSGKKFFSQTGFDKFYNYGQTNRRTSRKDNTDLNYTYARSPNRSPDREEGVESQ